jgi:hypothetical protein
MVWTPKHGEKSTGLFETIVGVLINRHIQYTSDRNIRIVNFVFPPFPASIPELKIPIRTVIETITADMIQTVWNELNYRVDVCRITKGAHIEHL